MFDVELLAGAGLWENIFNDRGYTGLSSGAIPSPASTYFRTGAGERRAGGEYVFEIIAFETALTGEQRAMVEAFLREKWTGVTRAGSVKVATASGTVLAVSGAEDVSTSWTGAGRILKTGGDSIDLGLNPSAEFSGDFRVAAGSLAIRSSFPYSLAMHVPV